MSHKEPINSSSLIMSIITLIIGIVLCFGGMNVIYELGGYVVGGVLILTGIVRFLMALFSSRKDGGSELGTYFSSIILVGVGIFIVFLL